jgi:hypothetical protein
MTRLSIVLIVSSLLLTVRAAAPLAAESHNGPFAFLAPAIQFTDDERRRLDRRDVVLRILPASGHELAVLAAGSLEVGSDALVASIRDMPGLKRGAYVPQIGVFSTPPQVNDVRDLTLDPADMKAIRNCQPQRPDDCDLKLESNEIARLQQAAARSDPSNGAAIEQEFRQILVDRAEQYGHRGDQEGQPQFTSLLQHSPYMKRLPHLASYLEGYPAPAPGGSESFLYWSKETYAWKPMITITHVTILHGGEDQAAPEIVVASRDLFSTRYTSGSLVLTLLLRDPNVPSHRYLVYINRTWVDAVRALWRPFVEYRVRGQAKKVFAGARDRIERTGLALLLRR